VIGNAVKVMRIATMKYDVRLSILVPDLGIAHCGLCREPAKKADKFDHIANSQAGGRRSVANVVEVANRYSRFYIGVSNLGTIHIL
jgi:hypothetical protein